MTRTRKFQLRLTEEEKEELDETAHKLDMSQARLIRGAIRAVSLNPRLLHLPEAGEGLTREWLRSEFDGMKREIVEKLRELLGGYSITVAGISKILEEVGRREMENLEAHRESQATGMREPAGSRE